MSKSKAKRYDPTDTKTTPFKLKKGNFLYIFLAPLFLSVIIALWQREFSAFIANIVSFGLFFATAKLNTIGLTKEYEYHTTTLTKAPKPLKTLTAGLLGISTFYTAWFAGGEDFFISLALSSVSIVGYFLYYGFDPKADKLENIGDISAQFVIETLATARGKLARVEEDMKKIKEPQLHNKLRIAIDKGYEILNNIEADPKDLRVARKFIIVYIDGVNKVTSSYTSMDEKDITTETKEKLIHLLSDVEKRFDKEIIRLKQNNQFDLEVQIDVLQEQIKN
jgi:5-bromo-4-chloroindolyl phosphate hydrolysis protein